MASTDERGGYERSAGAALERAHSGLLLHALYPLAGKVPGLDRVPLAVRRTTRRALTRAAVRAHLARCRDTRIVAVTGSGGKTTTKDLLATMLAAAGPAMGTRKNDNDLYGVPASLLSIDPRDRFAVIEVGILDSPGEMRWMASMFRPRVALLTGIGADHLPVYGSRAAIAREKRALLERLGPDGVAVVNADDELARAAAAGLPCRVVLAGAAPDADVRLLESALAWPHGLDVALAASGERHRGRIALHARHLAPCVALAVAAARECGVPAERALEAAGSFTPPDARMRPEAGPGGSILLLDDFKSRAAYAQAAVRALGEIPAARRIAVLGEDQDWPDERKAYAGTAQLLPGRADLVIAVGRAAAHLRSLLAGSPAEGTLREAAGFAEAARELVGAQLGEGDVVLIHGSTYQHLRRIQLELEGRAFSCRVRRCSLGVLCTDCPYLRSRPPREIVQLD